MNHFSCTGGQSWLFHKPTGVILGDIVYAFVTRAWHKPFIYSHLDKWLKFDANFVSFRCIFWNAMLEVKCENIKSNWIMCFCVWLTSQGCFHPCNSVEQSMSHLWDWRWPTKCTGYKFTSPGLNELMIKWINLVSVSFDLYVIGTTSGPFY